MKRWLFFCLLMVMGANYLSAETIYLKDGTREKSSKVWEQDGYIHFILKGTRNVEIRYAKEIVDRVEAEPNQANDQSNESVLPKAFAPGQAQKDQSASIPLPGGGIGISAPPTESQLEPGNPDSDVAPLKSTDAAQPLQSADPAANQGLDFASLKEAAGKLAGVSFYDPKRPHKYWASSDLQCDSIQQAIAALAEQYHMPSEWIEKNMGDTNDLGIIHQKLIAGRQISPSAPARPISASAETGKAPPAVSGPGQPAKDEHARQTAARLEDLEGPQIEGPVFYDPRRTLKYSISESSGYKTLKEALDALAQMYDHPPEWIEAHMGQTNDLNEIHRNLRQNSEN
jgi:hypothetical protein